MRRRILLPTVAIGAVLLLGGCAATMGGDAGGGTVNDVPAPSNWSDGSLPSEAPALEEGERYSLDQDIAGSQRSVITTGSVTITTEKPTERVTEVVQIVEASGGRIDQRYQENPSDEREAMVRLVVRIPSTDLTAVLEELSALGEVQTMSLSEQDVTSEVVDLDARITSLQTSTDRLLELLAGASETADLITIEEALSSRQAELESLKSWRAGLGDQVAFSTISLELWPDGKAPVEDPDNFLTGIASGWEALVAFLGAVLVGLGIALPWLVLIALVLTVLWLLWRRRRRSRARID